MKSKTKCLRRVGVDFNWRPACTDATSIRVDERKQLLTHKLFKWRTPPVLIDEQVLGRGDALNPRVEPLQKVFDGWAVPRSLLGHCLDYGEQVLRAM